MKCSMQPAPIQHYIIKFRKNCLLAPSEQQFKLKQMIILVASSINWVECSHTECISTFYWKFLQLARDEIASWQNCQQLAAPDHKPCRDTDLACKNLYISAKNEPICLQMALFSSLICTLGDKTECGCPSSTTPPSLYSKQVNTQCRSRPADPTKAEAQCL